MRLEPIEKPKGLMMRIAYWMTRRQMGKVMTPMKVVYGRMPRALKRSYEIAKFETKGIRLEPQLKFMVRISRRSSTGAPSAWTSAARWRCASILDGQIQRSLGIPDQPALLRPGAGGAGLRGASHASQAFTQQLLIQCL